MATSKRERILSAMDLEEPDIVPMTDILLDPLIVEGVTGIKTYGFGPYIHVEDGVRLDAKEISIRNGKALVEACRKLDFDAVVTTDYVMHEDGYNPKFLSETRYVDDWGKIYSIRKDTKTTWWIDGIVKGPEDLDSYEPPDPSAPGFADVVEAVVKEAKGDMAVIGFGHCVWQFAWEIRGGIDKMIRDMYLRPDFAAKIFDVVAKTSIEIAKVMIDTGIDAYGTGDDYCDAHGPLMGLGLFRKFILPYLKEMINTVRKRGIPFLKHTDGDCSLIMEDLIDAGISGFHPMEPECMSMGETKEKYGDKIFIMGNVDCKMVLPFGTEREVRADVRRCIDEAAAGGGYILASSNSLHSNVKVENAVAMADETRKYGRYPLRR